MSSPKHQTEAHTRRPRNTLRLMLTLSAIGFLLALPALFSDPSEAGSALLLGFSAQRWVLLVGAGLPFLILNFLALRAWRNPLWADRLNSKLTELFAASNSSRLLIVVIGLLAVILWALALIPEVEAVQLFGSYTYYVLNIKPLLFASASLAAFLFLYILVLVRGLDEEMIRSNRPLFLLSVVLFVVLLGLWLLIALTGIGLGFDITNWNAPGAPVLIWQVVLAAAISVGTLWLLARFLSPKYGWKRIDLFVFLAIWLLAAVIWLAQPQGTNYYAQAAYPPNHANYPLSDAFNHDVIAQNLLVGEGFRFAGLRAIRKPLTLSSWQACMLLPGRILMQSSHCRLLLWPYCPPYFICWARAFITVYLALAWPCWPFGEKLTPSLWQIV